MFTNESHTNHIIIKRKNENDIKSVLHLCFAFILVKANQSSEVRDLVYEN